MAKKIIAKSDGTTLIDHSNLVSKVAVEIAKQTLKVVDTNILESVRLGGLLHDIGKCQSQFQKKLKNVVFDEDLVENKVKHRHNEIGWAFTLENVNLDVKVREYVLDVIYWHHGISNKMSKYSNCDITIAKGDLKLMRDNVVLLLGEEYLCDEMVSENAPNYYSEDQTKNMDKTFIRSCLISADRLVSSGDVNGENFEEAIRTMSDMNHNIDIKNNEFFGTERFDKQLEIVDECGVTTEIKAPAGFGKTMLGILWKLKHSKKIIWVCPQNNIAQNMFHSIMKDLNRFGDHEISVQLVLGNEVKKANDIAANDFDADIIITNIDSYLSPTVNNRFASRLFNIMNYNVIFDEYHELVSDSPLFSCFINIMKIRSQMTNSKTLLLSATPDLLHTFWDTVNQKTTILPNKDTHYPAQHKTPYLINVSEGDAEIKNPKENNLVVYNSIANSQMNLNRHKGKLLYHSKFSSEDKAKRLNELLSKYANDESTELGIGNVVSTSIVRSSIDVTFGHVYESIIGPNFTLQIIGRCNRNGHYTHDVSINICKINNKGENKVKEILYDLSLSDKWFDFMLEFNGKKLTLDELYVLYNKFLNVNEREIFKYLSRRLHNSLRGLSQIYPIKFPNKTSDIKTAGGNKLRTINSLDIFFICKHHRTGKYVEPMSTQIYSSIADDFNESGDMRKKLLKEMDKISESDTQLDYSEILKNKKYMTLDGIRHRAKKSNTPYIRFDVVYHEKYGIISENLLINLLD